MLESIGDVARAAGQPGAGDHLVALLRRRLEAVAAGTGDGASRRVVCLEWAEPPFSAGHWVPEMVAAAGGVEVLGDAGGASREVSWDEIAAARPEVIVFMPCGYDLAGAVEHAGAVTQQLAAMGPAELWAVDATSYFSRPGPRLVDGVELLSALLRPLSAGAGALAGRAARIA